MFLCKILGLEDSFFRSLLYVFCLFVFYTVFGSIVYVTLVGLPLVATGFGGLYNVKIVLDNKHRISPCAAAVGLLTDINFSHTIFDDNYSKELL